jgi:hypothetical protein
MQKKAMSKKTKKSPSPVKAEETKPVRKKKKKDESGGGDDANSSNTGSNR